MLKEVTLLGFIIWHSIYKQKLLEIKIREDLKNGENFRNKELYLLLKIPSCFFFRFQKTYVVCDIQR